MAFDDTVRAEIRAAAEAAGLPPDALEAVVEVESGGRAFAQVGGKPMPLILWEYHVFHRCLPPELRAEALARGLAARRWGDRPYKRTQSARYAQLERGRAIHEGAAYSACSWGVGQVLGENWQWLGYPSARALAEEAMEGVGGQVRLMIRFIDRRGLRGALEARDWRGFARAYNGPGQVDHYAGLMAKAYARLGGAAPAAAVIDDEVTLRFGARGEAVSRLQQALRGLGHHLHVDGDFGPATRAALIAFQTEQSLTPDGIAGPQTWGRIEALQGRDRLA